MGYVKALLVLVLVTAGCDLNFADDAPEPDAVPVEVDAVAAPDAEPPDAPPPPVCACEFENAVCDHRNPDTGAHFVCICRDGAWDCNGLPVQIIACVPEEQWECTEIPMACGEHCP